MKKKLLALLLALAMLVGMLPASVFATSTSAAADSSDETAAADDDSDDSSEEKDYIGDSSYYYESVSYTDDDVSDYDADNSSDYSWSASATSDYYTMSGYYYAVTTSGTTTYYQVYYKVAVDSDGAISTVTLYYTTDGTNYSTIGTVSDSTSITLYKAYIDSALDYDALYAAINGTLAESSSSDITDLTILRGYYYLYNGTLYYVYYLYTAPSTTTDSEGNETTTEATITLFYASSESATTATAFAILTASAAWSASGTYTDSTDSNGDESDTNNVEKGDEMTDADGPTLYTEFELNISAYENTAQVFWDLDDSAGEYNSYDGDDDSSSIITSVTMTNTYSDTAQTVTFGESTDTTSYSAGTSSDSSDEWETPTGGLTLSSVYVDSDGNAVSDAAYADEESTLSITPAEGYYVSQVIIVCAPYAGKSTDSDDDDDDDGDSDNNGDNNNGGGTPDIPDGGGGDGNNGGNGGEGGGGDTGGGGNQGFGVSAASDESEAVTADETAADSESEAAAASEDDLVTAAENTGRLSPYQCSTYVTGQAYEGTFTLSDSTASSSGYTLTIDLSNEYFAHSGALATEETQVYFILIKVAAVPTPAYVEYDYGDIVSYISAYNTANELTSTSDGYVSDSIFTSNADGWTDTYTVSGSDGNVYTDNSSSSNSYDGTITGNGGVLTDDTQYEYVYDTSGTTKTSNWKHYANSITDDAVEAAAAAGYVFAGWAVTWYADASVASDSSGNATKTTSNYNYYTITFSNALYTSLRTEGAEVQVVGHVRLVAQWVKADDITQVIDYGLPVSTDVAEENEDDLALEAITSDVSSRTSSSTDYSTAKTTTLSTKITDVKYVVTTTTTSTTSTDDDGNETTSTSTSYATTASGIYGDFSLDSTDTDSGTAIYTLDTQMTGIESVDYQVTLSYVTGSGSTATTTALCYPTGTISIVPATSMYYEEDFGAVTTTTTDENGEETTTTTYGLVTYTDGKSSGWSEKTTEGVTAATYQEAGVVDSDTVYSTYGSDTYYLSNLKDSNGSTMYVDTTNGAASFSYEFTGTGTAIYSEISTTSAYIRVVVTGTDADGETKSVDTKYIDTRVVQYVGDTDTVLYNIPVYELTDLDYGTYTVTVTVAKAKTTVSATYQIATDDDGNKLYYQVDDDGNKLYYQVDDDGNKLYYVVDDEGSITYDEDGNAKTTTESNNYPVTGTTKTSYPVTGTTETDYPVYATDEDGNYVELASGESGKDFYLDGIRIYGPVETDTEVNDDYDEVQDVYEADSEANATALNVYDYLYSVSDALESGNEGFVTITDTDTGTITDYDDYFAVGPNNEVYLYKSSSSTDEETGETTTNSYSLSFYLLNYDTETYDIYIGMKSPDGTAATVTLGSTTTKSLTLNNSADCYYDVETYLESVDISSLNLTDDDGEEITTAYKLTITGSTGLAAITWIKVTSTKDEYEIAFDVNVSSEDEGTGDTEDETLTLAADTLYMVSEAAVAALAASDDDEVTDEDMLDDDSMGVDPEDDEDADSESDDTEEEEDDESVFEPETFSASITYLKLLRYASITVKTSSDVSYITVNGTAVTGRSYGSSGTKTFSYTASRVSSGTTFEIIAYNSDGTASESITLTAK